MAAIGQFIITDTKPDFLDNSLNYPSYRLKRVDSRGYRYYAIEQDNGEYRFFISNTSLISATTPTAPSLIEWMIKTPNHKEYAEERANYGTLEHIMFGWFMTEKAINLEDIDLRLRTEAAAKGIDYKEYWSDDFKDDLLAFATFVHEHNVEPLAIEVPLASMKDGYAGTVDLLCNMDYDYKGYHGEVYKSGPQKGSPKETKETRRIKAIVDFKSGRKGFYDANEIQLEACKRLVVENFGINPDKLFNFSPKEWRTTPDYNLKDQTDSVPKEKFEHLVEIAKIEKLMDVRDICIYSGEVKFGEPPCDNHFKRMGMNDYLFTLKTKTNGSS
jgi:hypothetical protein